MNNRTYRILGILLAAFLVGISYLAGKAVQKTGC